MNRLWFALAAYALLAAVEWFTLDGKVRAVALILMAFFAVRTLVHYQRMKLEAERDRERLRE